MWHFLQIFSIKIFYRTFSTKFFPPTIFPQQFSTKHLPPKAISNLSTHSLNILVSHSLEGKVNAGELHFESSFQGNPTCLSLRLSLTEGRPSHECTKHSLSFVLWGFLQESSDLLLLCFITHHYILYGQWIKRVRRVIILSHFSTSWLWTVSWQGYIVLDKAPESRYQQNIFEMIFAFLLLFQLVQYDTTGKYFLVKTRDDNSLDDEGQRTIKVCKDKMVVNKHQLPIIERLWWTVTRKETTIAFHGTPITWQVGVSIEILQVTRVSHF